MTVAGPFFCAVSIVTSPRSDQSLLLHTSPDPRRSKSSQAFKYFGFRYWTCQAAGPGQLWEVTDCW